MLVGTWQRVPALLLALVSLVEMTMAKLHGKRLIKLTLLDLNSLQTWRVLQQIGIRLFQDGSATMSYVFFCEFLFVSPYFNTLLFSLHVLMMIQKLLASQYAVLTVSRQLFLPSLFLPSGMVSTLATSSSGLLLQLLIKLVPCCTTSYVHVSCPSKLGSVIKTLTFTVFVVLSWVNLHWATLLQVSTCCHGKTRSPASTPCIGLVTILFWPCSSSWFYSLRQRAITTRSQKQLQQQLHQQRLKLKRPNKTPSFLFCRRNNNAVTWKNETCQLYCLFQGV